MINKISKCITLCHVFASGTIVIVLFAFSMYLRTPAEETDMSGHILQYQTLSASI
jgi:hypothetical protein